MYINNLGLGGFNSACTAKLQIYLGEPFHKRMQIPIIQFIILVKVGNKIEKGIDHMVVMDLVNHISQFKQVLQLN